MCDVNQMTGAKQQKCIFSWFQKLEVQDQGVGGFDFSEPLSLVCGRPSSPSWVSTWLPRCVCLCPVQCPPATHSPVCAAVCISGPCRRTRQHWPAAHSCMAKLSRDQSSWYWLEEPQRLPTGLWIIINSYCFKLLFWSDFFLRNSYLIHWSI